MLIALDFSVITIVNVASGPTEPNSSSAYAIII
jgi:hypothetical protein